MGKYQISVGLTFELIQLIEKKMEEGNYSSRSALIEEILRQNIDDECIQCRATKKLIKKDMINIPVELGFPFTEEDAEKYILNNEAVLIETTIKRGRYHGERTILDIIDRFQKHEDKGYAQLLDVIQEAERENIPRSKAEEIIEKLNQTGRLMRPHGYDTLLVV
jgi:Arc/MetJ-type ribon-helix-helix transcriptional regulator